MAKFVQAPNGELWEERDGRWFPVESTRAGGVLAAQGMGLGEKLLVGAGREFERIGSGIGSLIGSQSDKERIAAREAEATARIQGSKDAGAGAIGLGEMLPGLATLPLGMGVGGMVARGLGSTATQGLAARLGVNAANVAPAGLRGLAEQAAISGAVGGVGYSGDQGMDAMTGALLAAGGWGTGQLAGKVMGMIQGRGAATRAAMAAEREAQGAARLEDAGVLGPPAPPGMGIGAGGLPGGVMGPPEPLRFGAATRPGAEELIAGGGLPGQMAGSPGLTAEAQRQLRRMDELGIKLAPGTRTGSLPQQQIEASLQRSPYTAGAFEEMFKNNREILNRSAVKAIGEEGGELSQEVINNAHTRLGHTFRGAGLQIGTLKASDDVLQEASRRLQAIVDESTQGSVVLPEVGKVAANLKAIWEKAGETTGARLMAERSKLVKEARRISHGRDALQSEGLHDIIGVIDSIGDGAIGKAGRAELREARAQYRVLKALESGNVYDAAGNVSSGAAFQVLQREFPLEMRRGVFSTGFGGTGTGSATRDFMDLARGAQTFKSAIPNSGTATNMALQGLEGGALSQILAGAVRHTAGRAYLGAPGRLASEVAQAGAVGGSGAVGGGLVRPFAGGGLLGGF